MRSGPTLTTLDILDSLVGFDSTSAKSNLPLIDWIERYLAGHGVATRRSTNAAGTKANLHAVIGPEIDGGLALSGHVDTVPVDGQDWRTDPFRLHVADGRATARGACDMKGFVASCLAAVPEIASLNLRRPVHLFISFDEEVDCDGAHVLVRDLPNGPKPAFCVIGEPSMMKPIVAHKGRLAVRGTVRGRAGHSSQPDRGVNAVHAAAETIAHIAAEARRLATEGRRVEGFEPEHSTIHVGLVEGGTILNIIPEHAAFEMEWRTVPGDDALAELDRLRAHLAGTTERWMRDVDPTSFIHLEPLNTLPPLSIAPEHPLVTLVKRCSGANDEGKVSYGTEAGIFQAAGIASIVCGPGDIAQAHKPNEWIALEQLDACDRFVRQLALSLAEGAPS
ncbi:acetylornithine deacetylase [Acetobacteraceae bacterium KSS8]|uniref:Acetylornithine deacetylase n=1 Tax=Endosaccharibacter trunci TaxID=2812733 RepID=A0ABT1W4F4_9PROT|nr:acetylornithine deacetylase [Acetobacteraceae bacterium KSS8]